MPQRLMCQSHRLRTTSPRHATEGYSGQELVFAATLIILLALSYHQFLSLFDSREIRQSLYVDG